MTNEFGKYPRCRLIVEETLRVSVNLLKQLHATLLDSVRGRNKTPGRFRKSQNYIAPPGEPIERASYIPPVWEQVEPAMYAWESYIHADEKDPLVQLAIVKAQFELVHPFLDGNGRLGRMLVPLLLFEQGVLSRPMFYISSYLEQHRDVHYHRLESISSEGDWNGWIEFFLAALIEQARHNTEQTRAILNLYDRMKREVPRAIHSQYVVQAIDTLFDRPIFRSTDFVRRSAIPRDSALRILRELRKSGIITDLRPGRGRRPSIMTFRELLEITQE